jgi:hypothetical protein
VSLVSSEVLFVSSALLVSHLLRCSGLGLPSLGAVVVFVVLVPVLGAQMGSYPIAANSATGSSSVTTAIPSTVLGQVINAATGAPVPRALVRLNDRAVLTDHDGNFRFEQNTLGSANILVTKPGFSATTEIQDGGNLYLQGAQLGVPLELRLYPEAVLTGTVLAPDGTPLPRIPVTAMRGFWEDSGHRWVTVGQEVTDSHGNFRLAEPAGEYRLETRYTPLDQTTGEAVLPVTVPAESSSGASEVAVSQVIRAHAGEELHFELRPVVSPTHTVAITADSGGGRDFMRISARSSNGGTLQVSPQGNGPGGETKIQLPPGTYTLTARRNNPESLEQAETTVTVPDHDISGVVLQFAPIPATPVELIVDSSVTSDNNNQPPTLPQLGLALQSDDPDPERGDPSVRPTARRDQSYVFVAPPGSYRLQSRNAGAWYIKSASYGDADLLRQELVAAPGGAGTPIRVVVSNQTGSLQGTVNLNGSPAACWVYLISNGGNAQPVVSLRSNGSGNYSVAHLPPGSYQAVAFERRHSANYRDAASLAAFASHVRSVTVNAGEKPTLNLEAVPVAEVAP